MLFSSALSVTIQPNPYQGLKQRVATQINLDVEIVTIQPNPYQGLKHDDLNHLAIASLVTIQPNPYQGLKPFAITPLIAWLNFLVTIQPNPYQGLKLVISLSAACTPSMLQYNRIPIRD